MTTEECISDKTLRINKFNLLKLQSDFTDQKEENSSNNLFTLSGSAWGQCGSGHYFVYFHH